MEKLTQNILSFAAGKAEGSTISAKELFHFGSRAAIDQSLSRLARDGKFLRAGRGLYVLPVATHFGQRPPCVASVLEALAKAKGETIASHGATAANALGLTPQVPIRLVYLTSGRSRKLNLGALAIDLRHAPAWQLTMAASPAGEVIRALAWLGKDNAGDALRSLLRRLPQNIMNDVVDARAQFPAWLAEQVSQVVVNG
ncbi:MAG: hypothetical protein RL367_740 [Pseudomonadota bacterium]